MVHTKERRYRYLRSLSILNMRDIICPYLICETKCPTVNSISTTKHVYGEKIPLVQMFKSGMAFPLKQVSKYQVSTWYQVSKYRVSTWVSSIQVSGINMGIKYPSIRYQHGYQVSKYQVSTWVSSIQVSCINMGIEYPSIRYQHEYLVSKYPSIRYQHGYLSN